MKRKNSISLGEAIELMIDELKLKGRINEVRIRDSWARLMGQLIARHTRQISLKGGKLYIKVDSAPLKQELTYSRDKIKDLFNKDLGSEAIIEVIIF